MAKITNPRSADRRCACMEHRAVRREMQNSVGQKKKKKLREMGQSQTCLVCRSESLFDFFERCCSDTVRILEASRGIPGTIGLFCAYALTPSEDANNTRAAS